MTLYKLSTTRQMDHPQRHPQAVLLLDPLVHIMLIVQLASLLPCYMVPVLVVVSNNQRQCIECGSSHEWLLQCLQCGVFGCSNISTQPSNFSQLSVGSISDPVIATTFSCHLRVHIESTGHTPLLLDTSSGILVCLACNGKLVWNHHLQHRWLYGPDAPPFP